MGDSTWLKVGRVLSWMEDAPDQSAPGAEQRPAVQLACNAAAAYVESKHPTYVVDGAYSPPADILLGAVMLAARWFARHGSALGSAGFSEFGGDTILRHDPDVARLLRLGSFGSFSFGAPTLPPTTEVAP